MSGKILVVGSLNMDLVVSVNRHPQIGQTILGGKFATFPGGKGANQAVAAARAGASVAFVGRVGDDSLGREALAALGREGIATDAVVTDASAPSGVALIMVDGRGENVIAVASGANANVCAADVERARAAIEAADAVLVQLEIPLEAVAAALELGRAAGAMTVLNPAPAPRKGLSRKLLKNVTVLTPNRTEAAQLLGRRSTGDLERLTRGLRDLGVEAVALTLGADGVLVCDAEGVEHVPAAPANVVDTVGAGDCFSGVLAVGMAEGMSLRAAARFAVCAAALSCEKKGAQPSMPARRGIVRKCRAVFGNLSG